MPPLIWLILLSYTFYIIGTIKRSREPKFKLNLLDEAYALVALACIVSFPYLVMEFLLFILQ